MITFIHTADIHFGMENYGKIDPKTGIHTRLLDFKKALDTCIDYAIDHNVDFFMFSGDAYKTHHPSQTQQKLLMQCFLRLYKANIPVVIVVGNHDHPLSFGKAHALDIFGELPLDNFYVMGKPQTLVLHTKNGPIQIVGMPWPTRNTIALSSQHVQKSNAHITEYISHAVASIITDFAQKLDTTMPAILAGHLTVSNGIFSGSEKRAIYGTDPILLPSQLAIAPFDYVALGHLHRYQNLNPHGYPALVYSGSIERIDFGERKEEKGFVVVRIKEKGNTSHEFISINARPFLQIEVTLKPAISQTEQILDALKQYAIKDAVIKIVYHLPENTRDMVDLKTIQYACRDAMFVVGIIPIRKQMIRERRFIASKEAMDMPTLLHNYFASKPELQERKSILVEKALQLMEEQKEE